MPELKLKAFKNNPFKTKADILILGVWKEKKPRVACNIKSSLAALISEEMEDANFKGSEGEILVFGSAGSVAAKKIFLIGLGEVKNFDAEVIRRVGAFLAKSLRTKKARLGIFVLPEVSKNYQASLIVSAFAEGALLGSYKFLKYKSEVNKKEAEQQEILIAIKATANLKQIESSIGRTQISADATVYARDLVNEPASICTPKHLAEHAQEIRRISKGKVSVKVFGREECKKRGMHAFLSVAAGAGEEPYFIHLSYKPKGAKKKIALVGKGITFDSGGLQTKPGESMATMKLDMAGAAAVLGVFSKIVEISPGVEVHGIIAATENMPGPRAYKPGDIVRASNGKTIEIGHTDAEGRVTLADSLSYAARLKPEAIIDLATLTGACMTALGEEVGGLMSNNGLLAEKLKKAAIEGGEKMWELPLIKEYRQLIKGTHADVKNSGGSRYGGAITAGLFLEEFVNNVPWVHLDIAGPAWAERETNPYMPLGGTGFGVRTLINFLKRI